MSIALRRPPPSEHLLQKELRSRVRSALAALAPRDREILVMRYLEQLSTADIAGDRRVAVRTAGVCEGICAAS